MKIFEENIRVVHIPQRSIFPQITLQPGLCRTCSETTLLIIVGQFPTRRLKYEGRSENTYKSAQPIEMKFCTNKHLSF